MLRSSSSPLCTSILGGSAVNMRFKKEKPLLFRIHTNLCFTSGIRYTTGDIEPLKDVSGTVRQMLLDRGAISKVQAPPLCILPGWRDRAELFKSAGITDVDQLICADLREVSEKTQVPMSTLVLYVSVVKQFLVL